MHLLPTGIMDPGILGIRRKLHAEKQPEPSDRRDDRSSRNFCRSFRMSTGTVTRKHQPSQLSSRPSKLYLRLSEFHQHDCDFEYRFGIYYTLMINIILHES